MLYLAVILVALGFLCFAYVFWGASFRKSEAFAQFSGARIKANRTTPSSSYSTVKMNIRNPHSVPPRKYTLFNSKYPEVRSNSELEERILMERRLSANKQEAFSSEKETQKTKKFETQIDFEFTEEIEDFNDKSPVKGKLRQLRTDSFQIESEEEVQEETGFALDGILFLDYGRKIPYDDRNIQNIDWEEEFFEHFKRVGNVRLREEEDSFEFHHQNTIHRYSVPSLSQVIFYDNAFSLLPKDDETPIPLFFTEKVDRFKDFLTEKYE
ncbi:MAG: hypothetical protein H7A25_19210 [Leptospiraceae bacterium]|nr:hypothetical protein [Leptospiraceae bacterium]MCP5502037.1 hypothetical protein [Leptospiraceae bacterium]